LNLRQNRPAERKHKQADTKGELNVLLNKILFEEYRMAKFKDVSIIKQRIVCNKPIFYYRLSSQSTINRIRAQYFAA